ncbi:EpsG family protein [Planococcus versutus]|uniref:EpsG family protein n=1 Tax=Planococcus versutus TaxID=1302659 RepID=A0A1B1S2Y6_9BACL|nr:EpsG family protein [Planococcus versutus]ANU27548.1 hypothetical protein I858_011170 [Planococcus versutus]
MLYILSIVLVLINLLYAFVKKKKNSLSFGLMLLAWILFWGSYNNPDYSVYQSIYNSKGEYTTDSLEYGFITLIKLFNIIGFNYEMFLMTISLLSFYLIHSTVKLFTGNYNFVYSLYFIFPLFFDIVQIRNFLMMAIFIYSVRFLVESKKIKYLILIIIASTIQISALAFLPFMIINTKKKNYGIGIIFLISISISIILLLNNKEIPYLEKITDLTQSDKLSFYFETTTNYGFLLYWFVHILTFSMIILSKKLYRKFEINDLRKDIKFQFINLVYWINVLGFIYFPLYLLNSNFTRIMRNLMILNYIVIAITSYSIKNKAESKIYFLIVVVYMAIIYMILQYPFFSSTIKPILENNLMFKF